MPDNNLHSFRVDDVAMRYSEFAPRLFNFCLSLGMQPQSIMPSRAFCSDENQGYPIILLAKHFGTFPFNHGRVGGVVATNRHAPHADHGRDIVIVQASHVGYDADSGQFGVYRRMQTERQELSTDCGALCAVLQWYQEEYDFACRQVLLDRDENGCLLIVDNQLLRQDRTEGLFLNFAGLIQNHDVVHSYSTAKAFVAADSFVQRVGDDWPRHKTAIGSHLFPELFRFKRNTDGMEESGLLNRNLIHAMPHIISSRYPALAAAQVNVQMEFDRTFRTIVKEKSYRGKKVVFVSGIHIDVSPRPGQMFPLTKFVPWAAYIQQENGEAYTLEQQELHDVLKSQSRDNPHKIDLTAAIHQMEDEPEVRLQVDAQK